MVQVNKVPAGTGLVLKATTPGSAVNVPVFDGTSPDDVSGNKMDGSATETTAVAANAGYILSSGIFQPSSGGTLPAGKAYLNANASNGARSISIVFADDVTGISEAKSGVKAAKVSKFIEDGKLMILKKGKKFNANGQLVK